MVKTSKIKKSTRHGIWSLLTDTLQVIKPGEFLAIHSYHTKDDAIIDVIITFKSNYHLVCSRSVKMLEEMNLATQWKLANSKSGPYKGHAPFTYDDLMEAYQEVLESLRDSRDGSNEKGEVISNAYQVIRGPDSKPIRGVRYHVESNTIHLEGLVLRTTVIKMPPKKAARQSRPKTIAKDYIRDNLPVSKWRHYRLTEGTFDNIKVENITLTPEESKILL